VGQIKWGQLTFWPVTSERIYKIKFLNDFGRYKPHRAANDVMPILPY